MTETALAPAPQQNKGPELPPQLVIRPLVKKDPEDENKIIASITPTVEVVKRGELEGNPYLAIIVTKENFNEYVKFRGQEGILEILNAKERLDAQEALKYVATQQEAEFEASKSDKCIFVDLVASMPEDKKPRNSKGELLEKYAIDWSNFDVNRLYQTLLEGKVRGGLTIKEIEEVLIPDIRAQLNKLLTQDILKATTQQAKDALFAEAMKLSTEDQNLQAEAARIRGERKPRKQRSAKTEAPAAPAGGSVPVAA